MIRERFVEAGLPVMIGLLLFASSIRMRGANDRDDDGRSRVLAYAKSELGLKEGSFLRVLRREDLEEDVFDLQVKTPGHISRSIRVFELTDDGWEVLSKNEAVLHRSTAPARLYVAEDTITGRFFGLRGFRNCKADFNVFARSAKIELQSELQARKWAEFYISAILSEQSGIVVTRPKELERQVEDIAEAYRQSRTRPFSPAIWLRELRAHNVHPKSGIEVTLSPPDFGVNVDMLAISDDRGRTPVLRRVHFRLTGSGVISEESAIEIFPGHNSRH